MGETVDKSWDEFEFDEESDEESEGGSEAGGGGGKPGEKNETKRAVNDLGSMMAKVLYSPRSHFLAFLHPSPTIEARCCLCKLV
jgi:hypothetical protein